MTLIGSGTITRKLVGSASLNTLSPTTTGGIEIDLIEGGDSASAFGGESPATVQITVRKDTSANWSSNNPVLGAGEFGYIIEDKQLFVGDGITAYADLLNDHYIVHWDDLISQLSAINGNISNLESTVNGNSNDIATLQNGLSDTNTAYGNVLTQLSSLDSRTDSLETASYTLSLNLSSEATSRATADTSLQGQIDTLSGGVMKKYELSLNLSEIDINSESNLEIIVPTSGMTIMPLHASSLIVSDNISTGQSAIRIKSENDNNIFEDLNIVDDGASNGLTLLQLQHSPATLSGIDGKVYLYFTLGNTWAGANGTLKLTIFYMEV